MTNAEIARQAGVNRADVTNWFKGRHEFVSTEKSIKILTVMNASKAGLVLSYLSGGNTITMQQSLRWFGLASLSQTCTRLRDQGHDIRNIGPKGPHDFAIYALFIDGERVAR